ncbi:hypothetical protein VOLCADRAFT_104564 [Volvox carteri f. nagariensis]|uniref:Calcineurin-like phosphoesterase domain-containing protein n=1 Tax=Volvox carteri f. nagariensis TaxID=3068 RepID=D8TUG8_VOLCA|nr:uncharacterized protein VOLCADRAFT_104564 [Volvox carteri f. nagariensis]EFJ48704.1 hypothetical protein VOLCADRAFT_104564 [Volvox carteri f. nagariensis]|eukprot:XP_002950036.1 hypothetical protein VOLCADRAFT_104564 [Volvox carteri f. nagariensis]
MLRHGLTAELRYLGSTHPALEPVPADRDWAPLHGRTAVIAGAGPAGCTLAMHLAKADPRGIRPVTAVAEVPLLRERAYKGLVLGLGEGKGGHRSSSSSSSSTKKPIVLERTGVLMDRTLLATSLLDAAMRQYGSRVEFSFSTPLESVDFTDRVATFRSISSNRASSSSSSSSSGSGAEPPAARKLVEATAGRTAAAPAPAAPGRRNPAASGIGGEESHGKGDGGGTIKVSYDLLVGADGSSSTLRVLLAEGFPGQYDTTDPLRQLQLQLQLQLQIVGPPGIAGTTCYKSVYGLPPVQQAEAWAPDSAVPVSERLKGEFFFVLSGEGQDYLALLAQAGSQLPAEWRPLMADKLAAAPLSSFPVMRSLPRFWAPGGVVLVGDAAHTVTPALGQGLNSALEDCELLMREIHTAGGYEALDAALRRFSDSRVPEVRALQELELLQSSSLTPLSSMSPLELLPLLQLLARKWVIVQYSGLALLGTIAATVQAANRKKQVQQQKGQQKGAGDVAGALGRGCSSGGGGGGGGGGGVGGRTEAEWVDEAAARAEQLGKQLDGGAIFVRSPPMYELLRGHMPYREMLARVYGLAALGTGLTFALMYSLCTAVGGLAALASPGSVLPTLSTQNRSDSWQLAILGDLHLAPEQMKLFDTAREQLRTAMAAADGNGSPCEGARVVQLGDLGHGKHQSGSRKCFEFARQYLEGFNVPYALILGNHDLEGDEFETDEENLAAWREVFRQPHYWAADLGRTRLVGLSTERYRSNENRRVGAGGSRHHEVFISDDQVQWLEKQLADNPDTPFVVLTHAPPMGCGLKVIQEVHIKNRCAWLNHSAQPRVFMDLVSRHRNVKLWFSGHFHLSHNYPDSISTVGGAAFVQVGVIGECNRDGMRQSRLLRGGPDGYRLFTVDHDSGALRLDMEARWDEQSPPIPVVPEDELLCDPDAGWLCSQMDCKMGDNSSGFITWYPVGSETILALQAGGLLIEYDMSSAAPMGLVTRVPEDCSVAMLGPGGRPAEREDGGDVEEIQVLEPNGELRESIPRNSSGAFFRIYQPNKWRLKRQQQQQKKKTEEAAASKAEAEALVAA